MYMHVYLCTHTPYPQPVYFTLFQFFSFIGSDELKGLKKKPFVFDLAVFVYISLVLCSKVVCLGLSLFQSIYKLKI